MAVSPQADTPTRDNPVPSDTGYGTRCALIPSCYYPDKQNSSELLTVILGLVSVIFLGKMVRQINGANKRK